MTQSLWQTLNSRRRLIVIAGPCVIESAGMCREIASELKSICHRLDVLFIFKASYDKANRTSSKSYRGQGTGWGLDILRDVKETFGIPVLTDVHTTNETIEAGKVADVLQIPALLSRQTTLIEYAAQEGEILNIKKGQFMAPQDMAHAAAKAIAFGNNQILLTERGTTFGYNNLVADMRSIPIMQRTGFPVIFDATHSVQLPGGGGDRSSGQREFAPVLARAAVAAGADGVFIETHPDPDKALSDGPNMIPLAEMPKVLRSLVGIFEAVRGQ